MRPVYEIGDVGLYLLESDEGKAIVIRVYSLECNKFLESELFLSDAIEFLRIYAVLLRSLIRERIEYYRKTKEHGDRVKRLEELFSRLVELERWFDREVEKPEAEEMAEDVTCEDINVT